MRLAFLCEDVVYSPTHKRWKNTMMTKSATASIWGFHRYFVAIAVMVEMGMASFGSTGGSSSPYFFSRRAMGRSSDCWAGEDRRGSF